MEAEFFAEKIDPIKELTHKVNVLAWLYAELFHQVRVAKVRQALSNPDVMKKLRDEIANRIGHQALPGPT